MNDDLYIPSLTNGETRKTKSYHIGNLFFVAFFGGIIAVSILGVRNAKWLKLEKKYIQILAIISISLYIIKLLIAYIAIHQLFIDIDSSVLRIISKVAGLVCFLFYYLILKVPFKEHIFLNGDTEPLMRQGILWILIAVVIEGILSNIIFNI